MSLPPNAPLPDGLLSPASADELAHLRLELQALQIGRAHV